MSTCSTHVLDAVLGRPAVGVAVALSSADGTTLAEARTDDDGRVRFEEDLDAGLDAGLHRLVFATGSWFAAQDRASFHPEVTVAFTVEHGEHHHVALLLSPFSYTTYRGS